MIVIIVKNKEEEIKINTLLERFSRADLDRLVLTA